MSVSSIGFFIVLLHIALAFRVMC